MTNMKRKTDSKTPNTKRVAVQRRVSCAPATCTHEQLYRIRRDHTEVGDFCLMTDAGTVWLSEQKMGEAQKQAVQIPRAVFNRLLRWYQRPSKFIHS